MIQQEHETMAVPAELREWLEAFAAAVRRADYAAGRRLFCEDVVSFGTVVHRARGLDDLVSGQWQRVWERTSGFEFDYDLAVGGVAEGQAWVSVPWTSNGRDRQGRPFPRGGRSTFVFRREGDAWRAAHSHFSMNPVGTRGVDEPAGVSEVQS